MKSHRQGTIPKLEQLPLEQSEALIRWLNVDNLTYAEARKKLLSDFGVKTCSSSLSKFYHARCLPRKWVTDLARRGNGNTDGRVLVEIRIRANPDQSLSVAVIGGDGSAQVETTSCRADGSTEATSTIRVWEKTASASDAKNERRENALTNNPS
jgi:hypothetical protein